MLMLTMMGPVAEFERSLMLERQREGIAKAKSEGKYLGRGHGIHCHIAFNLPRELADAEAQSQFIAKLKASYDRAFKWESARDPRFYAPIEIRTLRTIRQAGATIRYFLKGMTEPQGTFNIQRIGMSHSLNASARKRAGFMDQFVPGDFQAATTSELARQIERERDAQLKAVLREWWRKRES